MLSHPVWVPELRIDPLHLLAGCRKRRLNQATFNLRGLIWLLMMDWSERGNIRKRGPLWEPFHKNSALCSWQANQSWFKERITLRCPTEVPEEKRKSECCAPHPQADVGPGAQGAHSGELCTGTDVDTGCSSRTKRPLSPGGTPRRMPRARWSILSRNRKKHHVTVRDLLRFLISSRKFS